jgi:outer membrane lipoprotein carrier protein
MPRACYLLLFAFFLLPVPPAGAESLNEVVAALEAPFKAGAGRNTAIYDMQAEFAQESYLTSLDRTQRGRGRVAMQFARPAGGRAPLARFRWEYEQPTEQLIVSDGKTLWVYLPENRQVIQSEVAAAGAERSDDPLLFLTGLGNLSRDFLIGWAEPARDAKGNYSLELRPRRPSTLIARLLVVVPREAVAKGGGKVFPILSTNVIDPGGNSTRIEFGNVRVNRNLPDRQFHFTIPPGVEVVRPDGVTGF